LNFKWHHRHCPEFLQCSKTLPNHRALEHDKHEQGEDGVVPVFIQAPQGHTKDLKDEKGGDCMLGEKSSKGRDRNVEFVLSV
jgi:hypothetical protein